MGPRNNGAPPRDTHSGITARWTRRRALVVQKISGEREEIFLLELIDQVLVLIGHPSPSRGSTACGASSNIYVRDSHCKRRPVLSQCLNELLHCYWGHAGDI